MAPHTRFLTVPERFLEQLELHRLAAQQPFQLAHAFFEAAHLGSRHHLVIGAHSLLAALAH